MSHAAFIQAQAGRRQNAAAEKEVVRRIEIVRLSQVGGTLPTCGTQAVSNPTHYRRGRESRPKEQREKVFPETHDGNGKGLERKPCGANRLPSYYLSLLRDLHGSFVRSRCGARSKQAFSPTLPRRAGRGSRSHCVGCDLSGMTTFTVRSKVRRSSPGRRTGPSRLP